MPLLSDARFGSSYVRVDKIFINSNDRSSGTVTDYTIDLKTQLQNVIAMEITGYNLPLSMAPTFTNRTSAVNPGNNKVDFCVSNGTIVSNFVFTWPNKQYTYSNVTVPYLSYVDTLQQLLNISVASDPVFGVSGANSATFVVDIDPEERTMVRVFGPGVTGFGFLFASGINNADSAYLPMGFVKLDTPIARSITSSGFTQLKPYRFVDVNIDAAAEMKPLKRIYLTDLLTFGTTRNDADLTRTRLLDQPVRTMRRLKVSLSLENNIKPVDLGLAHDFTLTVLSLNNEQTLPSWLKQSFVL
jgi:hypothetical protein